MKMGKPELKVEGKFKRVLLKLSGESLMGDQKFGIYTKF